MRVLHVVTVAGPDNVMGGPSSVATEQCKALLARGIEVRLVAGWFSRQPPESLDGVPGRFVPTPPLLRRHALSSAYSMSMEAALKREISGADLVHIHFARDLVPIRAAAIASGNHVPYVVQTHGMVIEDSRRAIRLLDGLAVRRQLERASRVLALTDAEAKDLSEVGVVRAPTVLPNGIALSHDAPPPRRDNEVLFLALLKATKRPMSFVQAAHRLIDEGRPYEYAMVGPDHGELGAFEAYVSAHGLVGRVRYEGALPRSEVIRRLAQATVYVLPSSYEPFGMSVLEALAARTPVVITPECEQAAELNAFSAAEVVEGHPETLAAAIDKLMSDSSLRQRRAEAGYTFVRERRSIEVVVDTLIDVYESAIGEMNR